MLASSSYEPHGTYLLGSIFSLHKESPNKPQWILSFLSRGEPSSWLLLKPWCSVTVLKQTKGQITMWIFLAWQDPETRRFQECIKNLFKVWLTYGWKTVRFWGYFHTAQDWTLNTICVTQTQTMLEHSFHIGLKKYIHR